jgi:hypothetical protein
MGNHRDAPLRCKEIHRKREERRSDGKSPGCTVEVQGNSQKKRREEIRWEITEMHR